MNETSIRFDQTEEEILTYEVSDEAIENGGGTDKEIAGNFTLGAYSGLSVCPG